MPAEFEWEWKASVKVPCPGPRCLAALGLLVALLFLAWLGWTILSANKIGDSTSKDVEIIPKIIPTATLVPTKP